MHAPRKSKAITIISLLAIFAGIVIIIGWEFNLPGPQTIFPQYVLMKFNTALCFILLGSALLTTQFQIKKYSTIVFLALSSLLAVIGTLSVSQELFHFDAGLDQLFIADRISTAQKYPFPGRMAANAAVCFALFGFALLGFSFKSRFIHIVSQYLLHLVTAISAMSIIGLMYGLSLFYNLYFASSMAAHTAILLFLLSAIASLLHPSLGVTRLFTGNLVGNTMVRRLFILLILRIVFFGVFRIQSRHYHLFSLQIDLSFLIICFFLAGLAIIWHTANWLNGIDRKRCEAEEEVKVMNEELEKRVEERTAELLNSLDKLKKSVTELREADDILKRSEANLKIIMDTTDTAYALLDRELNLVAFNQMAVKFLRSACSDIPAKGDQLADYFPKDRFPQFLKYAGKVLKGSNITYETNYQHPGDSLFWYNIRLFPITNDKNKVFGLMLALSDITEAKNAEESLKAAYNQIQGHINSIKDMAWKQSHLVRSPVANLKGLTAMLEDDPSDNEILKNIRIELERLDMVIIDMAEDAAIHEL